MKQLVLFCSLLICSVSAFAQAPYYILNTTDPDNVCIARDSILLKTGFHFIATGNEFLGTIDDNQLMDETYLDEAVDPDERELNQNCAVGSINGNFNVTPTGAATYNIPITVPPGTAGVQPSLSIVYSSQGGNGLLGMGAELSGLSAITRTGTTLYHDGFIDGVDFDDNDKYAWDGQRLIFEGNLTGDSVKYVTESESFARIVASGTSGNGPRVWTVWTKDGTRLEYGNSEDSRHQEQNSASVIRWMLTKITDRYGNYMRYYYFEDRPHGEWRIDSIMYTGNLAQNLMPYNKVKFYYGVRSDSSIAFVGGSQLKQRVLLRKIRTFADNQFAHEYQFRYFDDGFVSHLNEIVEVSHTGEKFNSTVLGWGQQSPFLSDDVNGVNHLISFDDGNYELKQMVPGDYNGNGKEDLFLVYKWKSGVQTSNPTFLLKWLNCTSNEVILLDEIIEDYSDMSFTKGDFNGDGFDDLLRIITANETQFISICINNANANSYPFSSCYYNVIGSVSENDLPKFYAVDMDGDRKSEIFKSYFDRSTNPDLYWAKLYKITCYSPFTLEIMDSLNFVNSDMVSPYEMLDFNGNGKTEVIHFKDVIADDQFKLFEFNTLTGKFDTIFDGGFPSKFHDRFFSDFNGDGKVDVLTYVNEFGWELHYSNGKQWVQQTCPINRPFDPGSTNNKVYTTDVNGDGNGDIVELYSTDQNDIVKVYFCHGYTFTIDSVLYPKNVIKLFDQITTYGDFDADGGNDFIVRSYSNVVNNSFLHRLSFYPNDKSKLLSTLSDGLNNKIAIEYQALTFDNVFYSRGIAQTYPMGEYKGSVQAVKTVNTDLGDLAHTMETTAYTYKSLKLHKQGKGILGMTEFRTKNTDRNILSVTSFGFNTTYFFPLLAGQEMFGGESLDTPLSSTVNTYQILSVGNVNSKRFVIHPLTTTSTDHLKNISVITNNSGFDNYGNITYSTTTYKTGATTEVGINTSTEYANGGTWCDYLPDVTTVSYWRIPPSVPTVSVCTDYVYDNNSKGKLSQRIRYVGQGDKSVTEEFGYDNFGNNTSATSSVNNCQPRTTTLTYDSKGRFALTKANTLNWTEEYAYDNRTGQVVKAWDVNDLLTKYQYDGFGRNVLAEYPDGTNSQQSLHWYSGTGISNACYYSQSQASASPPFKTWYDRIGRELISQSTAFNGQLVNTKKEYDDLGRPWKAFEPYFSTENPTLFTQQSYDVYGRNDETTLPTGVIIKNSYSGNSVTTQKIFNSTVLESVTKTMNSFGEPLMVTDYGGAIAYNYFSNGLLKNVTTNGTTVSMTYDIHGNRLTVNDPDAGLITTVYNGFDELISQTDHRSNTYSTTYDVLGRMLTSTGPDEATTYTYASQAGKLGQVTSVSSTNNTSQSFTYDNIGRIISKTEVTGSESFTQNYAYDSYSRLLTKTWNTGFGIQQTYNQNGYLSSIKTSSNQIIWQPNAYNARGQITDYVQGNNLQTTKVYQYGFQTGKFAYLQNQNIYSNNYTFDYAKGNLLSRTDYLPYYKSETFTYDNLNRLTSENIVNGPLYSTTFATNGNISHKDDIGYYDYGDAGPHAVTGLTSTTGTLLPANDQIVDYTAFNKVSHISQGNLDYFITYGPDRLRRKTQLNSGIGDDVLLTKYYAFGDYEKEVTPTGTRHLHYISGGDGIAAIYVKYSNAPDSLYFITTDHLGSIVGAINSATGTVYRQNFDAWGRKRNPVTWSYSNIPDFPFDRGYTGHEHLKWFGLINMNGRMYDAALCRFLSPDPFVQHPGYSQSYNRYTYCLNNPLKYTDPSGYTFKPNDWDAPVVSYSYYFGPGVVGPTIGWIDHDVNYSYVYKRLLDMPSGSGYTSESGFSTYTGGYGGVEVGIAYQDNNNSWGNTNAGSANSYFSEYINIVDTYYNFLSNLNNQLLTASTTGLDFFCGYLLGGSNSEGEPSFNDMLLNYLAIQSSSEVYKLIGGKVYQNYLNDPTAYANSCALRLSRALNYSGAEIPLTKGQTGSGSDGKWYFYRVKDLKNYLTNTYGSPDLTGNASLMANQKGIILFQNCGWSDASGHLDLWNGSNCAHECYWDQCGNASLWLLP